MVVSTEIVHLVAVVTLSIHSATMDTEIQEVNYMNFLSAMYARIIFSTYPCMTDIRDH